jgi:tetratricopeptide (TPR) repeat protein
MLKAGDVAGAAKVLTAAADLYPMESDWLIGWVLDLDKSNHKAEADAFFARQLDTYKKVCDRYPNAADLHNALAWTAARCGRALDTALDHAKKAVALRPDRAAYLDTLAEVHFRRGERPQAIEQILKAIDLEPTDAYLRAQLKRFESPTPVEWKGPNELGTPGTDDEN